MMAGAVDIDDALSLVQQDKDEIKRKSQEYDYIRFTWTDLNGAQRGVTYTARAASDVIDSGMQLSAGCMFYGPRSEIPLISEVTTTKQGNCALFPDPATFHGVPWAGGKYRVAEVLCESYWLPDNTPQSACPRYACRKQLLRLQEVGYSLRSGYEVEFRLEDAKLCEPVFSGKDVFNHTLLGLNEDYFFDAEKHLSAIGIHIERMQTETSPGEFEIIWIPGEGIQAADDTFVLKHGFKEMAARRGMLANFMTKAAPGRIGQTMHFNHSLWTINGQSAFYDGADRNNLSEVAYHWLAGLLVHLNALTALCVPSVNCYRGLHRPLWGHTASWDVDDRFATLRVKNYTPNSTYIESRLPTSVSNPYLVMAAHIAAGMDGVTRKLECPPPGHEDTEEVPRTLGEALQALEQDTVIINALGEELVAWFVQMKRQIDLVQLEDSDVIADTPEGYPAERHMYAKYV